MFTMLHISCEHTVHHSSKEKCIEVLSWGTYIVLRNVYCSHSAVVHDKLVSLQKELSSIFPAVIIIPDPPPFTGRWKLWSCMIIICAHQWPAWWAARFVCWTLCNYLCRRTIALPFCVNCFLAPLTNSGLLVQSYSKTSNRSSGHSQLSKVSGVAAKAQKTGATSS